MANTTLTLLAAGSLRSAFLPLVAHFRQHTGLAVDAQFGPAGLLRERIEAGSPCAVFASANAAHPQALLQAGLAQECQGFASNQLMLGQVLLADHNKAGAKAALEKAAGYSTNLWACRRAAELRAGLEASASKEI